MARSLAQRIGGIALKVVLGVLALVLVLLLAVTLAFQVGPVRELVRERANRALEPVFVGTVTVERIGSLGFLGAGGVDATVRDASGRPVLVARGLTVDTFWPRIVWTALCGDVIDVRVDAVRLRHVEVVLVDDGTGQPTLATAFDPKPKPTPTSSSSSGEVRVVVGRIDLEHAWVHGKLADGPWLDGDVGALEAGLVFDAKGLVTKLERAEITLRSLPEKLDPKGIVAGRFELPPGRGPQGSGRFVGTAAGTKAFAEGAWDGSTLHALLRAPDVPPDVVNQRFTGLALRDPVSVRIAADGKWPELRFDGELVGRAVRLGLRGTANLEPETRLSALVDARGVDLSGVVNGAPSSELSAHAEVSLRLAHAGAFDGTYRVDVATGRLDGVATPSLETTGRLRKPADGELVVDGTATVDEAGASADIAYGVREKPAGSARVHAELDGRFENPPRLAALGVRALGTLAATADFDAETRLLEARVRLRASSVTHEAVRAHAIALDAVLRGAVGALRVQAEFTAGPVDAVGRRFRAVAVTASGQPSELAVHALLESHAPDRIELDTRASFVNGARFDALRVLFRDREGAVELGAASVRASAGTVRVERLAFSGAGRMDGNVEFSPQRQSLEVVADELELERLAHLFGVPVPFERARLSADLSLARRRGVLTGYARARATEVRIGKLADAGASMDLVLTPRDISGTAEGDFGRGGRFHVELDHFELPKEPWTFARLARQRGSLVARGELRLRGLHPLVEAAGLPLERMGGTATFDVRVDGNEDSTGPRVVGRVETKKLRLVERRAQEKPIRTTKAARELQPRSLEGVDLRALFELEPKERVARADLTLFDPYGTILTLDAETALPRDWTRTLFARFRTLPLRATLDVPRRPFEIFPVPVRPAAQKGIASAHVELGGSVADPVLDARVALDALRVRSDDEPLSVSARAHYDRADGNLSLAAEARGRSVATFDATWRGDLVRLASTKANEESPIVLDADGELRDFPTEAIPALVDRQIRGPLRGTIHLADYGRDARFDVSLDGSKMTIGEVHMQRLLAELEASGGRARVRLEGGDQKGNAKLELGTDLAWGNRLAPAAPTRAEGRLTAHAFRLESLNPAVSRYLNELGGRLDADLGVHLEPGRTALSGQATLEEGVVQIPALGQRLTDVKGRLRIDGDRVAVDRVAARGATGRLTARASAHLDGLNLVSADAHLAIARREKVPVTFEGAALGDAWGRAEVEYEHKDGATELLVKVPSLHLELAEQGDLEVQSLDDVESIRIGARLADGTFTLLPVQPLESDGEDSGESAPMRVRVELGRDVEIERGRGLEVQLGGRVTMTSDGESRVTGRIELRGGKLDVQGKIFDIERGVVTFGGDPSNPTITATARWDSPAGYTVYADYRGDVRTGKITLHSEPPLNQDEIASLLLFGTPDGSAGASSGNTDAAATAVGVAGDTAARGINHALSNLTRLDVAARVDTSTGTSRPELVVQVTPRVAARVTRAVGEPQAGQPPDRTFLTVEFRFTRSWSVSAVVGDHGGSGMDVIWRRRY